MYTFESYVNDSKYAPAHLFLGRVDRVRKHSPDGKLIAGWSGERAVVAVEALARRRSRWQEGPGRDRAFLFLKRCATTGALGNVRNT